MDSCGPIVQVGRVQQRDPRIHQGSDGRPRSKDNANIMLQVLLQLLLETPTHPGKRKNRALRRRPTPRLRRAKTAQEKSHITTAMLENAAEPFHQRLDGAAFFDGDEFTSSTADARSYRPRQPSGIGVVEGCTVGRREISSAFSQVPPWRLAQRISRMRCATVSAVEPHFC